MTSAQVTTLILIATTLVGYRVLAAYGRRHDDLHNTVRCWDPSVVERLILAGADVNGLDADGRTPLHLAAEWGDLTKSEILLEYGARANVQDSAGLTPLHVAVEEVELFVAKLLLDHGADVTIADRQGRTPLIMALERSRENDEDTKLMACLLQGYSHGGE